MAVIHKVKDNSVKVILAEPELFAEFLRDFIPIDILRDVAPSDIEDMTERLISLVSEQKDGDTIKRINLNDGKSLFVIAIVEHESKVNFRAPFKMLLYIALILNDHEKEINKDAKITHAKDYKYPPILPIIFYDGESEWTAEMNFLDRTEMSDIFAKYIPKFEYELVSLKEYSFTDLADFGNTLSLFMMVDKLQTAEAFDEFRNLTEAHVERIDNMNVPPHLKKLLVNVITLLLRRIDVPQVEIETLVKRIDERGISEMLAIENYSVQATRREAKAEAEQQRAEAERKANEVEIRLKSAIKALIDSGKSIMEVAGMLNVTEEYITTLLPELTPA
ncbi:MAG: Rpn family recombination-promoting nuclease/putative transposase [Defluviitaleaceae bacterium]|nr:Rpn family recombination-promoting nuclease/putative transposase [Defluviitaleaceae bacterium]